jgi:hypothetical protein
MAKIVSPAVNLNSGPRARAPTPFSILAGMGHRLRETAIQGLSNRATRTRCGALP